ncbi:cytochrome P450 [Actinomadura sp. SCN-SB]|uniref:cytochrome P450 n=1 Tax=Actinomadura sp. SCN-SB TaxID=3373092 RepID=UPI003752FA5E
MEDDEMTADRIADWDPRGPETFDSAHLQYTEIRGRCPVAWSDAFGGFWSVFKYDDIVRVTEDADGFITSIQNTVPGIPRAERRPPLHIDPPEHRRYRRPLNQVFRKSVVGRFEPRFRELAGDLLEAMLARGGGDFSREFALPYAAGAFAAMLGLPLDLMLRTREIGIRYSFAIQDMDRERIKATSDELYVVAEEIFALVTSEDRDPETDMVAALLAATRDPDEPITERAVVSTIRQIIVAATGAPHAVLGSCAVHLARDAGLQERLRARPDLLPVALEEFLRLYSPYRVFARTATRDTTIRDRTIKKGEAVALIFPSGNRDEDHFTDPHTFRLDRRPNRHIAFGRGAHTCVAAPMARIELRVALEELLKRTASFELSGEVEMFNWLEFGPVTTPLTMTRRHRAGPPR